MKVEYGIYQRISGPGPEYLCRPLLDDKERLIFSGSTAQAAEDAARAWYAKNFEPKPGPKSSKKTTDAAPQPSTSDLFS